jgi:uncharacterized membrane protein
MNLAKLLCLKVVPVGDGLMKDSTFSLLLFAPFAIVIYKLCSFSKREKRRGGGGKDIVLQSQPRNKWSDKTKSKNRRKKKQNILGPEKEEKRITINWLNKLVIFLLWS